MVKSGGVKSPHTIGIEMGRREMGVDPQAGRKAATEALELRSKAEIAAKAQAVVEQAAQSVMEHSDNGLVLESILIDPNWSEMLSTGSTLLDLALTGSRVYGGGVPGGILMEIYGKSGSGKTSILSELGGSSQARGGEVMFLDPEARLDEKYSLTYGLRIPKDNYHRPDTVTEMFELLEDWNPSSKHLNVLAADSLAALSTNLEMEKGDKMGMRRAKEFSEGLRKHCRLISEKNWLVACSNQVRTGDYGDVTPGGVAVGFYSSARVSVNQKTKIEIEKTIGKSKVKRVIGICSECVVTKSSIDRPYRTAPIYIVFDYGIDDVRGNLQFIKDMTGDATYNAVDKTYQAINAAIKHIEDYNLEEQLRKETIELWYEIEQKFRIHRKPKTR